ncbi:beta-1,3-galactosyltransferase brn [Phlebotomus argentipes]|uniref:beta-1,3-galactosyltransferase brn n=1 Tax=Phlebotomus argentipes TaxID=94469 RepID=UPI002892E3C3|nr:beta-1,3-galactosyltransferase brn [Phlebotomus argentipes]
MFLPHCLSRFLNCVRVKHILIGIVILLLLNFFGAFTHIFEQDFYTEFHYPLEGDIPRLADQVRRGQKPDQAPITAYNHTLLHNPSHKCRDKEFPVAPRLVFLVKSALSNFKRRNAIRMTWGFERRFSDVTVRTVFLLGTSPDQETQKLVDIESGSFHDVLQADFLDTYFNNTIKTMTGLRWAVDFCPRSRYYMLVDDDFYISTKNVLRFVRNPVHYPEYLEEADETIRQLARKLTLSVGNITGVVDKKEVQKVLEDHPIPHSVDSRKHLWQLRQHLIAPEVPAKVESEPVKATERRLLDMMDLPADVRLYAGFVFNSSPHRHRSSKWYVDLEEYKWHMWPPYVSAGACILSREALFQLYFASFFTKHFRFDDIYLGIVALKANIEPLHSEEFYFQKLTYSGPHSYRYTIASHGYDNPDELAKVWAEIKAAGHA